MPTPPPPSRRLGVTRVGAGDEAHVLVVPHRRRLLVAARRRVRAHAIVRAAKGVARLRDVARVARLDRLRHVDLAIAFELVAVVQLGASAREAVVATADGAIVRHAVRVLRGGDVARVAGSTPEAWSTNPGLGHLRARDSVLP